MTTSSGNRSASGSDARANGHERAREPLRRVVLKLGTNLVTLASGGLDEPTITSIVEQVARLRADDVQVVIVSSGAVGAGEGVLERAGLSGVVRGRSDLKSRQAAAAVGQVELLQTFRTLFRAHGLEVAQALISRTDLNSRTGYLNVRSSLELLLQWDVVPIVNENDVVGGKELEGVLYGDNDRLSAMLANAMDADLLLLLGEAEGLYTADPARNADAVLIPSVERLTPEIVGYAGGPSDERGSGGMRSKLDAAEVAMASGIEMVIARGYAPDIVARAVRREAVGTRFVPAERPRSLRKRWLLTGSQEARGSVLIDQGAVRALENDGRSLLPAGVTDVVGDFQRGDIVAVIAPSGDRVAYGIANYGAADVSAVAGRKTSDMRDILERYHGMEVIHRDNLAIS